MPGQLDRRTHRPARRPAIAPPAGPVRTEAVSVQFDSVEIVLHDRGVAILQFDSVEHGTAVPGAAATPGDRRHRPKHA